MKLLEKIEKLYIICGADEILCVACDDVVMQSVDERVDYNIVQYW